MQLLIILAMWVWGGVFLYCLKDFQNCNTGIMDTEDCIMLLIVTTMFSALIMIIPLGIISSMCIRGNFL